jgi:electron transport complex protein RnfE
MSQLQNFTKGFFKENPILVLVLGTCPTLATTSSSINGMGMGIATTFVLIGSNVVISLLADMIPDNS